MRHSPAARRTLLLAAFTFALVYLPNLGVPLMWDDRPYLLNVPAFDRSLPPSFYVSPDYFRETGELTWRPLSTASYAALVGTFGRRPIPLRATSLALHVFACALLAALVAALGLGVEAAVTAAALFLIHPVHLETLMTVTFNKELLSTVGVLGLLVAHRRRRALLGVVCLAAGCLAKESGLTGWALVILLDFAVGGIAELKRRAWDHVCYALTAGAYLLVRFGPLQGPGGEVNLSALLPWSERLFYACAAFVTSARVMLAPIGLRIEYFALPASSPRHYAAGLFAASLLLTGLILTAQRLRRREPALAFFLLMPLPALFLVSNILPTGVLSLRLLAERWLYLPAAGVCGALAVLLRGKPARVRALIVCWAVLGVMRARDWRDEMHLWSSLTRVYPWSAKAVEGLGEALYRAGRTTEALTAFERGLELRQNREDLVLTHYVPLAPPGTIAWESAPLQRWLGLCRLRLGDESGAIAAFVKSAALQPSDIFSCRVLAYIHARRGDFSAARTWLDKGLALDSADSFLQRLRPDIAAHRLRFTARFD